MSGGLGRPLGRALLALMAVVLQAQQGPFSHKLHLQLKKQCTDCHASVATSTLPTDNLLPGAAVCKPCHDSRTIPAPRPTPLTHFSHAQHLKLGNVAPAIAAAIDQKTYLSDPGDLRAHLNSTNACLACHRGIDTSEQVSDANMPRMADCLVCHNQIDLPFSCAQCHDPKWPGLKPATHNAADFVDKHSTKAIVKQGCALCHGRKFTCMGCHLA
jgi:hypothetical protein